MCVYLRTKFQVSSIIITSFRQGEGVILTAPLPPPQNKPLKSPPRLGLTLSTHYFYFYRELTSEVLEFLLLYFN